MCLILVTGSLIPTLAQADSDGLALFKQEKYTQALRILTKELKKQPDNPALNFFMGRCLLALNQADKALRYLKKATRMVPDNPDYQFWLGIGYWANMEFEKERQSYLTALKLDPDHLMTNLYLGHNYMDRDQWKAALDQYDRVLAINPAFPDALYNRALVFRQLGKKADEKIAWKLYLSRYRLGKSALRAAENLNGYGDFSYRIYLLRSRRVVVPAINFDSAGSLLKTESLQVIESIGEVLSTKRALSLHVITYVKDDPDLAKSRSKAIKKYLLELYPKIDPARLTVSWFGLPEMIDSGNKTYVLDESVNIITMNK